MRGEKLHGPHGWGRLPGWRRRRQRHRRNESIRVAGEAFGASVLGPAAQVNITLAKPGLDRVTFNALDGGDVLIGNGGIDVLDGGPGSNVVLQ